MLIISKYHDYYDSVAFSKGVDKTIVYNREESQLFYKKIKNDFPVHGYHWSRTDERILTFIIGFCGKLYPVAKKINKDNQTSNSPSLPHSRINKFLLSKWRWPVLFLSGQPGRGLGLNSH